MPVRGVMRAHHTPTTLSPTHSLQPPITHHSQRNDSLTAERAEVPHFCAKPGAEVECFFSATALTAVSRVFAATT